MQSHRINSVCRANTQAPRNQETLTESSESVSHTQAGRQTVAGLLSRMRQRLSCCCPRCLQLWQKSHKRRTEKAKEGEAESIDVRMLDAGCWRVLLHSLLPGPALCRSAVHAHAATTFTLSSLSFPCQLVFLFLCPVCSCSCLERTHVSYRGSRTALEAFRHTRRESDRSTGPLTLDRLARAKRPKENPFKRFLACLPF